MQYITRKDISPLFKHIAKKMQEKSEILGEMDAKLGDGDLGLTMKKGFTFLSDFVDTIEDEDLSKTLMKLGMKLSSVIPSTMGFIMSSAIMTGGKNLSGEEKIGSKQYLKFLKGLSDGIIKRGKCKTGERTILDSVNEAYEQLNERIEKEGEISLQEASKTALEGAKKGLESTKEMVPVYGKAAVHKEAAKGVIDQGACAGMYLIEAIDEFIRQS